MSRRRRRNMIKGETTSIGGKEQKSRRRMRKRKRRTSKPMHAYVVYVCKFVCVCMYVCMYGCRQAGRQAGRQGGREGGMDVCAWLFSWLSCCAVAIPSIKKAGGGRGGRSASPQGKQRKLSIPALKNQTPRVVCVKGLRVKCFAGQSLPNWFAGFVLSDLLQL